MLCLTRRALERLQISDEIPLVVLRVVGNQVRFGIEAPNEVNIVREELIESRMQAERNSNDRHLGHSHVEQDAYPSAKPQP
jgi:carbon storage regulator